MTKAEIQSENNYFKLVAEAKKLGVAFNKVSKEDLKAALIKAQAKASKGKDKGKDKGGKKPAAKPAKKDAKPAKPAKKAVVVKTVVAAVEISAKDIKAITGLKTKKERVIKLVIDLGYPVAVAAACSLVDCHPTNAHAILRAAGLSTSGRTQSEETKEKIRATVLAKIAAEQ
jgi:hypothetical protein